MYPPLAHRLPARPPQLASVWGSVYYTDFSKNGTRLNDEALPKDAPALLRTGDRLAVGGQVLRVRIVPALPAAGGAASAAAAASAATAAADDGPEAGAAGGAAAGARAAGRGGGAASARPARGGK